MIQHKYQISCYFILYFCKCVVVVFQFLLSFFQSLFSDFLVVLSDLSQTITLIQQKLSLTTSSSAISSNINNDVVSPRSPSISEISSTFLNSSLNSSISRFSIESVCEVLQIELQLLLTDYLAQKGQLKQQQQTKFKKKENE